MEEMVVLLLVLLLSLQNVGVRSQSLLHVINQGDLFPEDTSINVRIFKWSPDSTKIAAASDKRIMCGQPLIRTICCQLGLGGPNSAGAQMVGIWPGPIRPGTRQMVVS